MAGISLAYSPAAGQGIALARIPAGTQPPAGLLLVQLGGGTPPPRIYNFTATLTNAAS